MSQVLVNESSLQDIANAIREKTEGTELILPSEMGNAIRSLGNGTIDMSKNPFMNGDITFNGQWQVGFETYDGKLYAEAIFTKSGILTVNKAYLIDIWGIGGGGGTAKGKYSGYSQYYEGHGGSGFTNMLIKALLNEGTIAVTIGAGGTSKTNGQMPANPSYLETTAGGATKLGDLFTANGGERGLSLGNASGYSGGNGGNNGGKVNQGTLALKGGENGTPGEGFITSKFRSVPHNTDYGRASGATPGGWGMGNWGKSATAGALVLRIALS